MKRQEIKRAAYSACCALIDMNATNGEGDLWVSFEGWSDADLAKVREAFDEIANELARRASPRKREGNATISW